MASEKTEQGNGLVIIPKPGQADYVTAVNHMLTAEQFKAVAEARGCSVGDVKDREVIVVKAGIDKLYGAMIRHQKDLRAERFAEMVKNEEISDITSAEVRKRTQRKNPDLFVD